MASSSSPRERVRALLVVEDNLETQHLLKLLLRDLFDVGVAQHYDQALSMAAERPYDLVLIDINLSEKRTGVELLSELRGMPHYDRAPIIACTAYALPGDMKRFLDLGFDAYIGKPFRSGQLLGVLSELSSGLED
jgi:two-component system, OmpR family, aerobic respiration control sensor histidine kinase ArcB